MTELEEIEAIITMWKKRKKYMILERESAINSILEAQLDGAIEIAKEALHDFKQMRRRARERERIKGRK